MNNKNDDLRYYKRKYNAVRHHAWAGSVLLAILVTIWGFLKTSNIKVDDRIIIIIGFGLIIYTLIAIVYTYKYRSGLYSEGESIQINKSDELEKERLKLEKKKAKAKAKEEKKRAKAKAKEEKKKTKKD